MIGDFEGFVASLSFSAVVKGRRRERCDGMGVSWVIFGCFSADRGRGEKQRTTNKKYSYLTSVRLDFLRGACSVFFIEMLALTGAFRLVLCDLAPCIVR